LAAVDDAIMMPKSNARNAQGRGGGRDLVKFVLTDNSNSHQTLEESVTGKG